MERRIQYRDQEDRVWYVSEVARLKVVSPSIDRDLEPLKWAILRRRRMLVAPVRP